MQKKIRNPILDNFFIYGSLIGETYFYQFILPILIWCGYQQLGIKIVLTTCIGNILSNMFKDIIKIIRPFNIDKNILVYNPFFNGVPAGYSFPSTHAMNSISNVLILFATIKHSLFKKILAFIWIFNLSFGRIYLGVHSPIDVFFRYVLRIYYL